MNRPVTVIQTVIIENLKRKIFFVFVTCSLTACPLKTELIDCTETSPNNYQATLRNVAVEGSLPLQGGASLELRTRMVGTTIRNYVIQTFEEPLLVTESNI